MYLALRVESRWFAKILQSKEAAAMIRSLFVSMQELNKGARRPAAVPAKPIASTAVVGAGFMGAGIANVSAKAGIKVMLLDRDQASADKGKGLIEAAFAKDVSRGRMSEADKAAALERIVPGTDFAALGGVDL